MRHAGNVSLSRCTVRLHTYSAARCPKRLTQYSALPPFQEIEAIRPEGRMPVARLLRRIGVPFSTWYYWRSCELAGRPVKRWPTLVLDAIEEPAAEL